MKQSRESYIHELIEDGTGIDGHCIGDSLTLQLWLNPQPTEDTTRHPENWKAICDYMYLLSQSDHDVSYRRGHIDPRSNALHNVEVMTHLVALAGNASVQGHHLTDYEMVERRIEEGDIFVVQTDRNSRLFHLSYLPPGDDPFYGHCLSQIKQTGYIDTILKTIEQGASDVNIITVKWAKQEGKVSLIRSLFRRLKAKFQAPTGN